MMIMSMVKEVFTAVVHVILIIRGAEVILGCQFDDKGDDYS